VTLLVISPDYASHLYPLASLATAFSAAGDDVVGAFGFQRVGLQLGRGSNPGVIKAEDQPVGEDDALRGFFAATRHGMIPTLAFQAAARSSDLLWEPVETARAVLSLVDLVQPDQIIVDHLAFSARLALISAGIPHGDIVLGHPSALPVGEEVYGYPSAWPAAFSPDETELEELYALCAGVRDRFTTQWNSALLELDRNATEAEDAFATHGDLLMLNYPGQLHDRARTALLPPHAFLGSAVRTEPIDPEVNAWLAESHEPVVYVSFGSFLSVRADVLGRVADALKLLGVRVAIATGSAPLRELGELPDNWLVREFLPQVVLLEHAVLAVTHGGNNSVTEAANAGVPMLVLPFSTDQFAGAAAIERSGMGEALPPNTATVGELHAAAERILGSAAIANRATSLGRSLRENPGKDVAHTALLLPFSSHN
jgi:zeaxanthin glucosyltransferase